MYHNFIHSSVDGPLGCSHVLAIVNSASVSIGVLYDNLEGWDGRRQVQEEGTYV